MKISIAMATYNGERYIKQQIESILKQMKDNDELIISDDASFDNTVGIINLYKNSNIKMYINSCRKGVVSNFENAIKHCKGDIIVLSDQDDIWAPNKLEIIRHYFLKTNYDILIHDAIIIDDKTNQINDSFYKIRHSGSGVLKNIFKNTYIGCCMAFKTSLNVIILPFPKNLPMHDMWIGILGNIFGKVIFINNKLTYYRRHEKNSTNFNKSSFKNILIWRINLIFNIIKRYLKIYYKKENK